MAIDCGWGLNVLASRRVSPSLMPGQPAMGAGLKIRAWNLHFERLCNPSAPATSGSWAEPQLRQAWCPEATASQSLRMASPKQVAPRPWLGAWPLMGGCYDNAGVTITEVVIICSNGNLFVDGTSSLPGTVSIRGGYASTGATLTDVGVLSADCHGCGWNLSFLVRRRVRPSLRPR